MSNPAQGDLYPSAGTQDQEIQGNQQEEQQFFVVLEAVQPVPRENGGKQSKKRIENEKPEKNREFRPGAIREHSPQKKERKNRQHDITAGDRKMDQEEKDEQQIKCRVTGYIEKSLDIHIQRRCRPCRLFYHTYTLSVNRAGTSGHAR